MINTGGTLVGTDSFVVHMTQNGGLLYRERTPLFGKLLGVERRVSAAGLSAFGVLF